MDFKGQKSTSRSMRGTAQLVKVAQNLQTETHCLCPRDGDTVRINLALQQQNNWPEGFKSTVHT